ncbi:uncharacterized protein LOC124707280 [Lolium rigidum]|uniref:uncharacterized protein LOC124707280 n=1 Tax=Lolium rigidum TaxID=89674 RepID=UPI001F5D1F4B|nr:uncharacterized protein LOC124707280 [Lolium rigidum]
MAVREEPYSGVAGAVMPNSRCCWRQPEEGIDGRAAGCSGTTQHVRPIPQSPAHVCSWIFFKGEEMHLLLTLWLHMGSNQLYEKHLCIYTLRNSEWAFRCYGLLLISTITHVISVVSVSQKKNSVVIASNRDL